MTMPQQDYRVIEFRRSVPFVEDRKPLSLFGRVAKRARDFGAMVRQRIDQGVNSAIVTIVSGILSAGVLAVVALSWNTSMHMASLEERVHSMNDTITDMKSDLADVKRHLQNDRSNGGAPPN